jgi:hypothetical protein
VDQTELVLLRIRHDDPSRPGLLELVAEPCRSEPDEPIAFGPQFVTHLDVDVEPVLAARAPLGTFWKMNFGPDAPPGGMADRYCSNVPNSS